LNNKMDTQSEEEETEYPGENDIDVIEMFLRNFKEYTELYVIPEFGKNITHEKIYDFVQKNK